MKLHVTGAYEQHVGGKLILDSVTPFVSTDSSHENMLNANLQPAGTVSCSAKPWRLQCLTADNTKVLDKTSCCHQVNLTPEAMLCTVNIPEFPSVVTHCAGHKCCHWLQTAHIGIGLLISNLGFLESRSSTTLNSESTTSSADLVCICCSITHAVSKVILGLKNTLSGYSSVAKQLT